MTINTHEILKDLQAKVADLNEQLSIASQAGLKTHVAVSVNAQVKDFDGRNVYYDRVLLTTAS